MKMTMKNMQPTGIDDLSAVNALYRPGSMKFIDNYIARMHGLEEFEYLHPDLESVLGITYGIIVFQEQLIQIGRLAGMRNPDLLRQATGKKNPKLLAQAEPELREGLYKRGWTKEKVDELMTIMIAFASYSFNKAHSQAYAIIAFICAFLKAYHPKEFMCAWFNSLEGHHDKIEVAYKEAKRLNITINDLSFRNVVQYCTIEGDGLNYGLSLIKHCNKQIAEDLTKLKDIQYNYYVDFLVDIKEKTSINTKQLNILTNLGYLNEFGSPERLIHLTEEFTDGKNRYSKTHKDATKEKRIMALRAYEELYNDEPISMTPYEKIQFENEHYGFIRSIFTDMNKRIVGILDIDMKYTPKVTCYIFKTGEIFQFKVKKDKFFGRKDIEAFDVGDMIVIKELSSRNKQRRNDDGTYTPLPEIEYYLESASKYTKYILTK